MRPSLLTIALSSFHLSADYVPFVSKAILCFWCGCFGCGSGPFLCCFAVFPAGETQIWPGDLRVVAVFAWFLFVWFWICLELWNHGVP